MTPPNTILTAGAILAGTLYAAYKVIEQQPKPKSDGQLYLEREQEIMNRKQQGIMR